MSKEQFKKEDFGHVTEGLITRIEGVIADRKHGRSSSGAIYKAHNELFKLREPQQTCTSCLVIRGDKLAKWYEWNAKQAVNNVPQGVQIPVANAGKEGDTAQAVQATHDTEAGNVLTVLADGSVQVDGKAAEANFIHFLKDGTSIVIGEDGKITPEATDYAGVVDKYALVIGDDVAGEYATLTTVLEENASRVTPSELALVQARYDELAALRNEDGTFTAAVTGTESGTPAGSELLQVAEGAVRGVFQKVNKDTYATEGDSFYGDFTASAEDASKGVIVDPATGKAIATGTYATEDVTRVLSVQPGGKATYKAVQA